MPQNNVAPGEFVLGKQRVKQRLLYSCSTFASLLAYQLIFLYSEWVTFSQTSTASYHDSKKELQYITEQAYNLYWRQQKDDKIKVFDLCFLRHTSFIYMNLSQTYSAVIKHTWAILHESFTIEKLWLF